MKTKLECSLKDWKLKCPFCKADFGIDYKSGKKIYLCPNCQEPVKVEATIRFDLFPPTAKEVLGKMIEEVNSKKTVDKEETLRMLLEFAGMPKDKEEKK